MESPYILSARLENIPSSGKGEVRLEMVDYDFIAFGWHGDSSNPSTALIRISNEWDSKPWMGQPVSLPALMRSASDPGPGLFVIPKPVPQGYAVLVEVFNVAATTLGFVELSLWGKVFREDGLLSVAA